MTIILDPQDDLWEPGTTIRWPKLSEARLVEHPGHGDQKVHGRRGGGGDLAALDAELRQIRGAERIVAMKGGRIVFDKGGAGTNVHLDSYDDIAMFGAVATHNHPTGWNYDPSDPRYNGNGPSGPDLETAWRAGVAEMRIVTPTQTFSIKPGTDTTWGAVTEDKIRTGDRTERRREAEFEMARSIANTDFAVQSDFRRDIAAGRKTIQQAENLHYIEVTRRLSADMGWEFSVSHGPNWVDPMAGQSASQIPASIAPQTPLMQRAELRGASPLAEIGAWGQAIATEVVRLLEHPGHGSQKVHGRRGTVSVTGTQLANISAKTRGKIEARRQSLGMPTSEQMAADIGAAYEHASAAAKEKGMGWYEDVHTGAVEMATRDASGKYEQSFNLDQTAGVLAVCSPTRQWASNYAVGKEICSVVGHNRPFEVTRELGGSARPPIKAGIYKPSDLSPSQLAWTHPQFKNAAIASKYGLSGKDARSGRDHYDQIATSVSILRGDTTPDVALTGVKTRNFYNNIYDPRSTNVTVDDWAYKSALTDTEVSVRYSVTENGVSVRKTYTGPATDAPYGTVGDLMQTAPAVKAEGYNAGVYPVVAEAYSIAAAKAGILPHQMQAIVWESARESGIYGG